MNEKELIKGAVELAQELEQQYVAAKEKTEKLRQLLQKVKEAKEYWENEIIKEAKKL